ncbi:MAG: DUF4238 domain-containing protein, partial [Deinococcota bacterium]
SIEKAAAECFSELAKGTTLNKVISETNLVAQTKEGLHNFHLEQLFNNTFSLAKDLQNFNLHLIVNQSASPFWTSDNPVVTYAMPADQSDNPLFEFFRDALVQESFTKQASVRNTDRRLNSDFQIFYPISPYLMIEISGIDQFKKLKRINFSIDKEDFVIFCNYLQFAFTSLKLYSHTAEFKGLGSMYQYRLELAARAVKGIQNLEAHVEKLKEDSARSH